MRKTMNLSEAIETANHIYLLNEKLKKAFPCIECKGQGVINPEWYGWHPCESCYGEGWLLPNEDEEWEYDEDTDRS